MVSPLSVCTHRLSKQRASAVEKQVNANESRVHTRPTEWPAYLPKEMDSIGKYTEIKHEPPPDDEKTNRSLSHAK